MIAHNDRLRRWLLGAPSSPTTDVVAFRAPRTDQGNVFSRSPRRSSSTWPRHCA